MAKEPATTRRSNGNGNGRAARDLPRRMLVVVANAGDAIRAQGARVASAAGTDVGDLNKVLRDAGARIHPLFGESEDRLQARAATMQGGPDDDEATALHLFYEVDAPDAELDRLAERLAELPSVAGAYVKPPPEPASAVSHVAEMPLPPDALNPMLAAPEEAPPATANFTPRQTYLGPAPQGIDALYAWTVAGGRGAGVQVIDCEGAWRFTHEDLRVNQGGVIGAQTSALNWRNHGTAVVGVIGGDVNTIGVTGIATDASVRGSSIFDGGGLPGAIRAAADRLRPGDVILLEVQYSHSVRGFTSVEWWPDDYAAIRYAVSRGIVVVEAAGNGGNNLDDPVYNTPAAGFPASWRNPFNPANPSSGAVLVGAGNPPTGTHNRTRHPVHGEVYVDRARCFFSNYGSRIDCQGWGWEVTTAGYGDLQGGTNEDLWYTDEFSGTSSASPIVVGALSCVQGALRAAGRIPLSPARARELLRGSGSPQQDAPGRPRTQRIGNRPNLRQLIPLALQNREWIGVQFTGAIPPNTTLRWFTHSWPAHWHVLWSVVPTSPRPGAPQIGWSVQVERATDQYITYWIAISNLTAEEVRIEARYAVQGW